MMASKGSETATLLASYPAAVQEIVERLRRIVLDIVPEAIEQIDLPARMLAYGFASTYNDTICVIMPQKTWVNLGFPRGAEMADPAGMLTGTGKWARHVKITDTDRTENTDIRRLVEQAATMARKRRTP